MWKGLQLYRAAQERATPLSPAAWKEMLRSAVAPRGAGSDAGGSSGSPEGAAAEGTQPPAPASPGPLEVVVLDVRNGYEWDAGHFVGATRPLEVPLLYCLPHGYCTG